ncbi:MAG: hypothetical protein ACRENO_06465, partial [Thermodesulfobacteriota bacterium]
MNIYSDPNNTDNPVGFSYSKVETDGKKVKTYEKSRINIKAFEVENSISSSSEYILVDNQIESFNYTLESFPESYKIYGKVKDAKIIITTITNSDSQTKEYEAQNDYLVPPLFPLWLADGRLIPGADYEIYIFDPFMIASDFPKEKLLSKIKIYDKEKVLIGSEYITAYKVDYDFLGSSSNLWIEEDGTIVKEIIPPGFVSMRSNRNGVEGVELKSFDIVSKTSIQPDKEIKDPSKVKYMKFKLNGIDESGLDLADNYNQFK